MPQRCLKTVMAAAGTAAALAAMAQPAQPAPAAPASSPAKPGAVAGAASAPDATPAQTLHALFDAHWEASLRTHPEFATYVGDPRYGDRLTDASPQARAAEFAAARAMLARAQAVRRAGLQPTDRASLDIFIYQLREQVRSEAFTGYRSMSLGALGGFQTEFAELLQATPIKRAADAEQVLARMAAYPRRVEQELAALREGQALKWVPPRTVLERVLAQVDGLIGNAALDTAANPYFEPFTRLGDVEPPAQRDALQARARAAIDEHVLPALRSLRDFVSTGYLAAAPEDGALSGYPGGAAVYASRVLSQTTTTLGAAEIHAIGLRETARLRREMEVVMKRTGFEGSFADFTFDLNHSRRFYNASPEAMLESYRAIARRIDPELPRLFAVLPRTGYGVRAMPAHLSADAAESYSEPTLDGSRPGWFNANTAAFEKRPTWGMETLVAHELVPGHHLQIARAVELTGLPKFRRAAGFNAYGEGWALYAETLGFELGLYQDPYSHFGHLQSQAFRAARLVVDTGIHALGWKREQAIAYMLEQTGENEDYIASEVDRYTSDPGQALGYMIGQLKIIELRERARARLGTRFDIRQFHRVVLDLGSVPLPVLERSVDEWLEAGAPTR